jgi:hypothetical protein
MIRSSVNRNLSFDLKGGGRPQDQTVAQLPDRHRSDAHEPVRPRGVTDEDSFRQRPAARGNFHPWTHAPNQVPLDEGVSSNSPNTDSPKVKALRKAWLQKKAEIFAGKLTRPDSEDPDTVNHLNWYMSTGFTRPYPGERAVRPPSEFNNPAPAGEEDGDD